MSTAVVTGAAGFIGSTLAEHLLSDGWTVVGVDALTAYYSRELKRRNLARLRTAGMAFHELDLTSANLAPIVAQADVVFHLAGQPGVRASWGDEFEAYARDNILATNRLLTAVASRPVPPRVVYASSSSVYGDALRYPTGEDVLPQPISPYGVSKLAGEHLVGAYAAEHGVQATSFRFFTVYGPRQRPDMAFHRFLTAALQGDEIRINGDGAQVRDFTYVDDIVDALVLAADAAGPLPAVMNLAGGTEATVSEVLQIVASVTGAPLRIRHVARPKGDVLRTTGDSALARTALGWAPATALAEGIERQWHALRDQEATPVL